MLVLVHTVIQYTRLPTVLPLLPLSESSLKKRGNFRMGIREGTERCRKGRDSEARGEV
jgi:hypothetical protein